ncbi:ABC transporter ATP-binding protein [Pelovirga terrestris]|uniref:ATP-binding cassette domain-containing protein n=1 Tax=Pelovirga terrestris TaxID=2771352 RepID=A0A8J6QR10_9BACT|nr:ATP-binding cassette domain-containing protein [Pelovirga terrestris]MBD1401696.1 ATP-binding cassette domain-containing protein [Pelovirga terrestris]
MRAAGSTLFSNLSLTLEPGEKLLIKAPSGFGKSTLLRALLGFVPISAGSISIFGNELTSRSAWQLRSRMAYVDQEPDLGDDSVETVFSRPFSYKRNRHLHLTSRRITELMSQLGLPDSLRSKKITTLSGGEKQRIALISALLLEREILLLDEPTSALDEKTTLSVARLLREMKELTILAISHDPSLAGALDRTVDLRQHTREPL